MELGQSRTKNLNFSLVSISSCVPPLQKAICLRKKQIQGGREREREEEKETEAREQITVSE